MEISINLGLSKSSSYVARDTAFVTNRSPCHTSEPLQNSHETRSGIAMARASTRISIRWPPAAASESTDTLVLGLEGYYVDLRVQKSDLSIDWLLAGERIVDSKDARTREAYQHCQACAADTSQTK